MATTNCCHGFLAFHLKFLNFLQFFVGVSAVIYSAYMLNQWGNHRAPTSPPPPPAAPSPVDSAFYLRSSWEKAIEVSDDHSDVSLYSAGRMVSGSSMLGDSDFVHLPAAWFIYFSLGAGVVLCCVSGTGYIAAEAVNGCCLCFYTLLVVLLFMIEGALVAFFALDHSWKRDLPFDPTGELENIKSFIGRNTDICKWVGIAMLLIQASSLLLAFILRAMVTTQRKYSEEEDDYDYADARGRVREPLLSSQQNQGSTSMKSGTRTAGFDNWSSRIKEKYGLSNQYVGCKETHQNP